MGIRGEVLDTRDTLGQMLNLAPPPKTHMEKDRDELKYISARRALYDHAYSRLGKRPL